MTNVQGVHHAQEPTLRLLSFEAAMGSGVAATMDEAAKTRKWRVKCMDELFSCTRRIGAES